MNKTLKPNLIDPLLTNRIVKTLKPATQDYWGPTRNLAQNVYQKFIKPNIYFFLFILFIIIVLLFRYRSIKLEREHKEYDRNSSNTTVKLGNPNFMGTPNFSETSNFQRINPAINADSNNYEQDLPTSIAYGNLFNLPDSDMALLLYEQQKELLREPKIKYKSKYQIDNTESDNKKIKTYNLSDERTPTNRSNRSNRSDKYSGYVYPVYPNFPGGTLSANKRR